MPLRAPHARTAALVALAAAVVAFGAAALAVRERGAEERRLLEDRASTLADALESSLTEAMGEHRPESLGAISSALARTEGVAGLAIADRKGAVRHAAGAVPSHLPPPPRARFEWTSARLSLSRPVENAAACR